MFKHTRLGNMHIIHLGRLRLKFWRVGKPLEIIPGDRVFSPVPRHCLEQ
jgi:hypothetical protein